MREFKIGDRVEVIANNEISTGTYYNVGDKGTIIENSNQESLEVQFDEGSLNTTDNWWIADSSIKLIKEEE